jgi:hypothetical protein
MAKLHEANLGDIILDWNKEHLTDCMGNQLHVGDYCVHTIGDSTHRNDVQPGRLLGIFSSMIRFQSTDLHKFVGHYDTSTGRYNGKVSLGSQIMLVAKWDEPFPKYFTDKNEVDGDDE